MLVLSWHLVTRFMFNFSFFFNTVYSLPSVVKNVPLVTSLQSSPATSNLLNHLTSEAKKIDLRRHHGYFENNMEKDEYHEILNNLDSLCQKYDTGVSVMDDSDDD